MNMQWNLQLKDINNLQVCNYLLYFLYPAGNSALNILNLSYINIRIYQIKLKISGLKIRLKISYLLIYFSLM